MPDSGSKRLVRIARTRAMALDVYKDLDLAREFLRRPHHMFNGRSPLEVAAASEEGTKAVVETLGRLKYGSAS
ncbi:putative toxin-antitoxin system antitoxin component (TIGR02293 family) [Natronocella acetinitrilica]|uniref:Toxin-antitoxin system antitoxin component (TIGR02293 family) n=1 Tax=Natronocella acetinitrilica TaxID=414046 RepID=A0AAE3G5A2_9GAMM|nr:MbcA/ParS/Xre antitoxin family protein [Natronocella acetinitrilica]MCP1675632.1 putative toxin-antitoxin system antitoxin component (TIGR02293 family) [Natronocella acetinitrilica]